METSDILSIISICISGFLLITNFISFLFLLFKYKSHEKLIANLDIEKLKRELNPDLSITSCRANKETFSILKADELQPSEVNLLHNSVGTISFEGFRKSQGIIINALESEDTDIYVLQNLNTITIKNNQSTNWKLQLTRAVFFSKDSNGSREYKVKNKDICVPVPANDICTLNITYISSTILNSTCDAVNDVLLYDRNIIGEKIPKSMMLHPKLEIYVEAINNQNRSIPYLFTIKYENSILTVDSHIVEIS